MIERKELLSKEEKELALKLKRAESIIEGLSSEKQRWEIKVTVSGNKKTNSFYYFRCIFDAKLSFKLGKYPENCSW